jgi:hypothetical protein
MHRTSVNGLRQLVTHRRCCALQDAAKRRLDGLIHTMIGAFETGPRTRLHLLRDRTVLLHVRLPHALHLVGIVGAGPGRHGDADRFRRLVAVAPELECVSVGMAIETPANTSTVSSLSPSRRRMRPLPATKYQISSIVLWATAFDTRGAPSEKCAMPPRLVPGSRRTSDPLGRDRIRLGAEHLGDELVHLRPSG